MPQDHFHPKQVIPSGEFSMQENPDSVLGVQANESFLVKAQRGHVLGSGGETTGFAKYQYGYDAEKVQEATRQLADLNTRRQELLRDPNVLQMLTRDGAVNLGTNALNDAQDELKKLADLGDDHPDKIEATRKVDDSTQDLQKKRDDLAESLQAPEANEFFRLVEQMEKINTRARTQDDIADISGHLFENRTAMRQNGVLGGDRAMLTRSVASKTVDNLLNTGSIAEEKFGVDSRGRNIGISIQADGAGVTGTYQGKDTFLDTDYSDPRIQKGLSDLEVNDYITGQIDRHSGNIFIDPQTGKVTGIDNDLSFPERDREVTINGMACKAVSGLPSRMHKDTADRIAQLDPEELRRQLQEMPAPEGVGRLSEASINGAVERLQQLKEGIEDGRIQVVNAFDKHTYDAAIEKQDSEVKQQHGLEKGMAGSEVRNDLGLGLVKPTSYQGAIAIQQTRRNLAERSKPDSFGKRPENSVRQATRDARYEAYQRMDVRQQKQFDKKGDDIARLEKDLARCQARLERQNTSPNRMDKFKAFFTGGMDQVKAATLKEESKLATKLINKQAELDQFAGMEPRQQFGRNVAGNNPENQNQNHHQNQNRQSIGQQNEVLEPKVEDLSNNDNLAQKQEDLNRGSVNLGSENLGVNDNETDQELDSLHAENTGEKLDEDQAQKIEGKGEHLEKEPEDTSVRARLKTTERKSQGPTHENKEGNQTESIKDELAKMRSKALVTKQLEKKSENVNVNVNADGPKIKL